MKKILVLVLVISVQIASAYPIRALQVSCKRVDGSGYSYFVHFLGQSTREIPEKVIFKDEYDAKEIYQWKSPINGEVRLGFIKIVSEQTIAPNARHVTRILAYDETAKPNVPFAAQYSELVERNGEESITVAKHDLSCVSPY